MTSMTRTCSLQRALRTRGAQATKNRWHNTKPCWDPPEAFPFFIFWSTSQNKILAWGQSTHLPHCTGHGADRKRGKGEGGPQSGCILTPTRAAFVPALREQTPEHAAGGRGGKITETRRSPSPIPLLTAGSAGPSPFSSWLWQTRISHGTYKSGRGWTNWAACSSSCSLHSLQDEQEFAPGQTLTSVCPKSAVF